MRFASRQDAGRQLGQFLRKRGISADLVLGLPRGGVVVAAEVARILKLPLDVLVVRKIGHPWHREFAVGAVAENGVLMLDDAYIGRDPAVRAELNTVIAEETKRLNDYLTKFCQGPRRELFNRSVLIVDDG